MHLAQGWEFAHSLIAHLLIRSYRSNQMSDLLRSLKTNERMWANRSVRSEEMRDRKRIPQVAEDKWAAVSDSLRSLRGNEWMSDSFKKCWQKKYKILFLVCFIYDLKKIIEKIS